MVFKLNICFKLFIGFNELNLNLIVLVVNCILFWNQEISIVVNM